MTLSKEIRRYARKVNRGNRPGVHVAGIHHTINRRVEIAARLAQLGDRVVMVESGMDCDCAYGVHWREIESRSLVAIDRDVERIFDYAEGPTSVQLVNLDEAPEPYTRDLALEAFEDGHPHVVYPPSI